MTSNLTNFDFNNILLINSLVFLEILIWLTSSIVHILSALRFMHFIAIYVKLYKLVITSLLFDLQNLKELEKIIKFDV